MVALMLVLDKTVAAVGGATDIRLDGNTLGNRIIVAGGGAGGGRDGTTGVGGGLSGTASSINNSGYPGNPGTQSSGGTAYITTRGATNGSLGQGGNGSTGYNSAGGGGGGRWLLWWWRRNINTRSWLRIFCRRPVVAQDM